MARFVKLLLICSLLLSTFSCSFVGPEVSVFSGNYLFQQGKSQQATLYYLKSLGYEKHSDIIYYNLGNNYYSLGEGSSALDVWDNAESSIDTEVMFRLNFNRGVYYYQMGQYKLAYDFFRESLKINRYNVDAKINLELALSKLKSGGGEIPPPPERLDNSLVDDTERMLNYIRRKEELSWKSSDQSPDQDLEDW